MNKLNKCELEKILNWADIYVINNEIGYEEDKELIDKLQKMYEDYGCSIEVNDK